MLKRLVSLDDGPEISALVSAIAAPLGYVCETAGTFEQFRSCLAGWPEAPAVIVVDVMMPGVDGVEVLRYLAEQRCPSRILLLSRVDKRILAVVVEMALASGLQIIGALRKPFTRTELELALRQEVRVAVAERKRDPVLPAVTEDELRRAIAGGQLVLYYQPRIDCRTGAAAGVEVSVRWRHPLHGVLHSPAFVDLAGSPALASALAACVMRQAFADAQEFASQGWMPTLSINVSAFFLRDTRLPELLFAHAQAADIAPARIIIDIRESGVIERTVELFDILARLRLLGFNLSIHDFGTGFSMVRQLRRIPASEVRIDKEFIRAMTSDHDAGIIVRKTIELGHELGMTVVAEDVRSREQFETLRQLGCDLAQGDLISEPMTASRILDWRNALPS